jgi:hypothetical protein
MRSIRKCLTYLFNNGLRLLANAVTYQRANYVSRICDQNKICHINGFCLLWIKVQMAFISIHTVGARGLSPLRRATIKGVYGDSMVTHSNVWNPI